MRRRDLLLAIVAAMLAALIVGGVAWWKSYHRFDAARWKAVGENRHCTSDIRGRMVGDLRANHLREGMSASEVRKLLGPAGDTERYPDRQRERQDRYFLRKSKRLFDLSRKEYIEQFGHPDDLPQEGFAWVWNVAPRSSDCDELYVRFVDNRVVETAG